MAEQEDFSTNFEEAAQVEQEAEQDVAQAAPPPGPETGAEPGKSTLSTIADLPEAVAGLVAGGVQGLAEGAVGFLSGSGEAYSDSMQRFEDAYKERAGREVYENTISDLGDIATMIPMLAAATYRAAASKDPFSGGKDVGEDIGEDALLGLRWTAENIGRASKAFPAATLMSIVGGAKAAGNIGRISKAQYGADISSAMKSMDPIASKVRAVMDTEIPGTIRGGKKLVKTDSIPGTLFTRAIGDEGLRLKDMVSPAAGGAALGMLVGAPEWGALAMVGGKTVTGMLAKRSPYNKDIVGGLGRLVRHTSAQAKVSDEVAVRSIMQHGPRASAAYNAAALMVAEALKTGTKLDDVSLDSISRASGIKEMVDIGITYEHVPGHDLLKQVTPTATTPAYSSRRRKMARLKLDEGAVKALDNLEKTIKDLGGEGGQSLAGHTLMALDDLLSGESVQFARDSRVMMSVIDEIKSLDPSMSAATLRSIESMADKVSRGPIFGDRSVNPRIILSNGDTVDIRSLATNAWKKLDNDSRSAVVGRVSAAIMEENKNTLRGIASAKAMDFESQRVFGGDEAALKDYTAKVDSDNYLDNGVAAQIYTEKLLDSSFLRGDALPLVSARGVPFSEVASILKDKYLVGGELKGFLTNRLSRELSDTEVAGAQGRLRDIIQELDDLGNETQDIGKMGAELSRSVVADGLESRRLTEQLQAARDAGLISADDFKSIMDNGLTDAFDIALGTDVDARVIRTPLRNTYYWLVSSQINNPLQRVNKRLLSWTKAAYTTMNPASHVNNMVSNIGLVAMDRGIDPGSVIASAVASKRGFDAWKKTGKAAGRDADIFKQVEKMGFIEGDLISAEITALANVGAGYGPATTVVTSLDRARALGAKTASTFQRKAGDVYKLGDTTFKFDEAIRTMRNVYSHLDELEDGQFFDLETSPVTVTRVTKKNGKLIVAGRRSPDDAIAAHARLRANELFFDYAQRPGALRFLDQLGVVGSFVNPYMTWYWKALGIGGKGLFRRINRFDPLYATDNPTVLARLAKADFYRDGRRAAAINAMRSEFERHPEEMADAMKFYPDEVRQMIFLDLGDPRVMAYRDITSLDWLNPTSGFINFLGSALAKAKGTDRAKELQATGHMGISRQTMQLLGMTGSPAAQLAIRISEGQATKEDVFTALVGSGLAQAGGAVARMMGSDDYSAYDKLKRLPPHLKPTAEEYYFRRLTSIGWDRRHMFGKVANKPGKITRYLGTLKSNLKKELIVPVLDDYRAGVATGADINGALSLANEMYLRRIQELFKAATGVLPSFYIPPDAVKPIKLKKSDL